MDPEDLLKHNIDYGQRQQMIRQLQNQQPKGPPCPHCGGPIPKAHVKVCMHCRGKLAWVENYVCAPGEEEATRIKVTGIRIRQQVAQRKADKANKLGFLVLAVMVVLMLTGGGIYFAVQSAKERNRSREMRNNKEENLAFLKSDAAIEKAKELARQADCWNSYNQFERITKLEIDDYGYHFDCEYLYSESLMERGVYISFTEVLGHSLFEKK